MQKIILFIDLIKFGKIGIINKLEIDTHHFKGNYPDYCSIQTAAIQKKVSNSFVVKNSSGWKVILNKAKLKANKKHVCNKKNRSKHKNKIIPQKNLPLRRRRGLACDSS